MKLLRIQRVTWDHYRLVWFDPDARRLSIASALRFERARDAVAYAIRHGMGFATTLKRSETPPPPEPDG